MLNRIIDWFTSPKHLIGASVTRIVLGAILVYNYVINYPLRHFYWADSGVISNDIYNTIYRLPFSVYGLSDSAAYFEVMFHAGLIFSFLFMIGTGGKFTQIMNFLFTFSLINRNAFISDGGDNILYLCLFYMLFMNVTAYFSVTFLRRPKFLDRWKDTFAIIHNFGLAFVVIQLSIMYFTSGIYQIMGERWNSGTALYYILQVEQYSSEFWEGVLTSNTYFIVFFTYASILIKLAFPLALFNKYAKYIIIAGIIAFHIGIAIVMGLITFSAIMIGLDFLLLNNKEYQRAWTWMKRFREKLPEKISVKGSNAS
ncbi:HTTM domain-containing protein [Halobacillus sp. ACCC02827]|uniref:hypothetical protein n=1 Tax=Bacillaceae TaxID=186817 RepID=UPI0004030942|nr:MULTISPECIES: hypothetical protein [Bacillaceae]QHT46189.1 HTTM domain-containing protein [Bacillus sp. SB49]WJE17006.1 HTTM domain-containing protein [Halobacillus sp. ACCC02827]